MSHDRPTISTHVLDTGLGLPAVGVPVRLTTILDDGAQKLVGKGVTDVDGRIGSLVEPLLTGTYRLTFELHEYRRGFFREVTLEVAIDDVTRSYHVPLLIAPFGVTSYRGT
jgi:5-hydroxyisourate hydrolase